jgi:8-oxo-dGTP diphosphatase
MLTAVIVEAGIPGPPVRGCKKNQAGYDKEAILGNDAMPRNQTQRGPRRLKVLAAFLEKDGRILIAKRRSTDRFGGRWEFPGGKLEPGETPRNCLRRELMEEFGVETRIGRYLGAARSVCPAFSIELIAYEVFHLAGEFQLLDHDDLRWVLPSELSDYDLTEPDKLLLGRLIKPRSDRHP